jgi:2-keto-4-pentenoate hydratase
MEETNSSDRCEDPHRAMTIRPQRMPILIRLAAQLGAAWKVAGQIEEPTGPLLPEDRDEAYFVQDRMAEVIGEELSGWKVGATSSKMRELDGHDDVIPGRIFRSVTWQGEFHALASDRFSGARAETEFAFRLSRDLPVRADPWTPQELLPFATLHPAIEIIGNRHALKQASKQQRSLMTIADNGGGIGFVFGGPVEDWQAIDFQNHEIWLRVDGGDRAENFLGQMRCEPIVALADLANHLRERGIGLKKGDFVSTGAATVPQPVAGDSHVIADFGTIGKIEIRFG